MRNQLIDERLANATCTVLINNTPVATAWLVSDEGHLLTAGHVLCIDREDEDQACVNGVHKAGIKVQFSGGEPLPVTVLQSEFDKAQEIDFAVLKLKPYSIPSNSQPLPLSLEESFSGEFKLYGFDGQYLKIRTVGLGKFVGFHDSEHKRLFRLHSPELVAKGFSGGAIYSEQLNAVVAIQIAEGKSKLGATKNTVFAMPLYRIAHSWNQLYEFVGTTEIETDQLVVHVAVVAMTANEAQELVEQKGLPQKIEEELHQFDNQLKVEDLPQYYGASRDEWRPFFADEQVIRDMLYNVTSTFNQSKHNKLRKKIVIRFLSDKLFSPNEDSSQFAQDILEAKKGILIIDAMSMYHPQLEQALMRMQLMNANNEVSVIVVRSFPPPISQIEELLKREIYKGCLRTPYRHFHQSFHPLYEFDISTVHRLKRCLFSMLPQLAFMPSQVKDKAQNLFQNATYKNQRRTNGVSPWAY